MNLPRILVCGGRNFSDRNKLYATLDRICEDRDWIMEPTPDGNYLPNVVIISGAAKGADTLAIDWAAVNWQNWEEYPADWDRYGRSAGHLRNQQMLDEGKPDLVVAFRGGRGTANMIERAKKAGVEVIQVE